MGTSKQVSGPVLGLNLVFGGRGSVSHRREGGRVGDGRETPGRHPRMGSTVRGRGLVSKKHLAFFSFVKALKHYA